MLNVNSVSYVFWFHILKSAPVAQGLTTPIKYFLNLTHTKLQLLI